MGPKQGFRRLLCGVVRERQLGEVARSRGGRNTLGAALIGLRGGWRRGGVPTRVVVEVDHLDDVAGPWGVHHLAVARVHAHVAQALAEKQVTGLQLVQVQGHSPAGPPAPLFVGGAGMPTPALAQELWARPEQSYDPALRRPTGTAFRSARRRTAGRALRCRRRSRCLDDAGTVGVAGAEGPQPTQQFRLLGDQTPGLVLFRNQDVAGLVGAGQRALGLAVLQLERPGGGIEARSASACPADIWLLAAGIPLRRDWGSPLATNPSPRDEPPYW